MPDWKNFKEGNISKLVLAQGFWKTMLLPRDSKSGAKKWTLSNSILHQKISAMEELSECASWWKNDWQKQQWQGHCTEVHIWRASSKAGLHQEWILQTSRGRCPYCQRRHKRVETLFFFFINCALRSKKWNRKTLSLVSAISGTLKAISMSSPPPKVFICKALVLFHFVKYLELK